jgi:putative hydrolase of the HAD superfamily
VKAVLVDLDDTLLDYSGGVDDCWAGACAAVEHGIEPATLVDALAAARQWFWSDPERHRRERVDMLGAWRKIVEDALRRCAQDVPDGTAAAIAADFAARRRAMMRLFPDARACLERLKAAGIALALVTNGDARQQRDKIERHALAPFFDVIVIEGEFGAGKPDEVVYRAALEGLGACAHEACMVGDHLEFDVAGPQRLGLRGVWIDRAGAGLPADARVQPDRIIRALSELDVPLLR